MILQSRILGKGRPLVILHGLFGMLDNWQSLGKKFAENFEVHLIDQRNHGKSFHHNDCSFELMAEDLRIYIEHHNLSNVYIIGHSMGGKVAMFYSVKNHKKVEKLIVVDIAPKKYSITNSNHVKILDIITGLKTITSRKETEVQLKKNIPEEDVRQFLLKNLYWKSQKKLAWRCNFNSIKKNLANFYKGLQREDLFNKKTLFIKGKNSNYILNADLNLIKYHFPLAQIKSIAKAGHWVHAENPIEFYKTTMNFLCNVD